MTFHQPATIKTFSCATCYVCGSQGNPLYRGMKDTLFGASGEWDLKQCPSPNCGLVWLDPMPCPEDINRAYAFYYTHQESVDSSKEAGVSVAFKLALARILNLLLTVTGLARERRHRALMYLGGVAPGRLLEVGCGDGRLLVQLRTRGWLVTGQDIDPKAAERARTTYGLDVHLGPLETASFAPGAFDAIVMNHVIEHVHDPVTLMAECARILKPGGSLVIVTPNIESYGHRVFGAFWRGLEPPRHLHIFSLSALTRCAELAGFRSSKSWTTPVNAASFYLSSRALKDNKASKTGLSGQSIASLFDAAWFKLAEIVLGQLRSTVGEELVLKADR